MDVLLLALAVAVAAWIIIGALLLRRQSETTEWLRQAALDHELRLRKIDAPEDPAEVQIDFSYVPLRDVAEELHRLNFTLEKLEQKRRRPRIVECKHPELHSDDELVAGSIR